MKDLRWISAFGIFGTGIAGGFVWGLMLYSSVRLSPGKLPEIEMTYAELAAVMLAAVGVMVTILGVIIALLAFVGRTQIKNDAHKIAEKTATNRITDFLGKDGKPSDGLRKILIERVDEILLTNPEVRAAAAQPASAIREAGENDDEVWGDENSDYGDDN